MGREPNCLVNVNNVSKMYPGQELFAVKDVSFSIEKGQVLGIVGRNGSGKSTLSKMLAGLLNPSKGSIDLGKCSENISLDKWQRRNIAYLTQSPLSLNSLTVYEAISMFSKLYKANVTEGEKYNILSRLGLSAISTKNCSRLSGGQRKLVQLAIAIASKRRLIILDEPTNELDPLNRRLVWDELADLANEGRSVVVVTHAIAEVESILTNVLVMKKGCLIACREIDSTLITRGDEFTIEYNDLEGKHQIFTSVVSLGPDIQSLVESGATDLSVSRTSLEDIFIRMIKE